MWKVYAKSIPRYRILKMKKTGHYFLPLLFKRLMKRKKKQDQVITWNLKMYFSLVSLLQS